MSETHPLPQAILTCALSTLSHYQFFTHHSSLITHHFLMWRKSTEHKQQRLRVGLALSGGAARGAAHVGVLKVLLEAGVPVDCVAGTSAGALVGGAFAAGMNVPDLEELGREMRWRNFGRMTLSRLGVQSNARMEEYIRARFPLTRFEELPIPFAAVATDLHSGQAVVMRDEGDLAFAIRASCAVPGWYVPVTDAQGRQLVDGGLVANLPAAAARSLGPDIVIAVDVNAEGAKFLGPPQSAIGVLFQSIMVVQRTGLNSRRPSCRHRDQTEGRPYSLGRNGAFARTAGGRRRGDPRIVARHQNAH
jgi:NTE family protein